jgi:hypothetical protein
MTCIKEGDLECARELMSPFSQHLLDNAESLAGGVVNLDDLIKTHGPKISAWTFERAQFSTRDGTSISALEGQVEYLDGKRGKVSLEFEQAGETWKVRSSSMEE